jgi:hypothetical protein
MSSQCAPGSRVGLSTRRSPRRAWHPIHAAAGAQSYRQLPSDHAVRRQQNSGAAWQEFAPGDRSRSGAAARACNLGCSSLSYALVHRSTRIRLDLRNERLRTPADPPAQTLIRLPLGPQGCEVVDGQAPHPELADLAARTAPNNSSAVHADSAIGSLPISSRAHSGPGSSRLMGSKFLEGALAGSRRAAAAPQNPHKSGVRVGSPQQTHRRNGIMRYSMARLVR